MPAPRCSWQKAWKIWAIRAGSSVSKTSRSKCGGFSHSANRSASSPSTSLDMAPPPLDQRVLKKGEEGGPRGSEASEPPEQLGMSHVQTDRIVPGGDRQRRALAPTDLRCSDGRDGPWIGPSHTPSGSVRPEECTSG